MYSVDELELIDDYPDVPPSSFAINPSDFYDPNSDDEFEGFIRDCEA